MGHTPFVVRMSRSINKRINRFYAKRIPLIIHPVDYYVSLLEKDKPFAFARFGDGEWAAMFGYPGANCDGHEYFPELGAKLRDAVTKPLDYFYGIQYSALANDGKNMWKFIDKNDIKIQWHNANVFHYANRDAKLNGFIRQLRQKRVVVIGGSFLRGLNTSVLKYEHFIDLPAKNCFLEVDRVIEEVQNFASKNPNDIVYAFSASMMTNVVIHKFYPTLGKTNWLLDLGSLWDMYLGVNSRNGYGDKEWEEISRRNLM